MRSPTRKSFLWTVICFTVEMIIIYLAALLREHRFLYGGAAIGIVYLLVSLRSLKQTRKRMEHPGGDGNGNKRNRRKSRKRAIRGFTRIVLCLLPVLGTVKLCGLVGAAFLIPGRGDSVDSISVEVTAKNAAVMSADTGALLYQKNGTDRIAPASTAKMITALTVLDVCSPDDEMTVGEEIRLMREDSSRAWLNRGDMLTVRQLLIALLLPSGNDAAYTLAANAGREIAGDRHLTNEQSIDVFMDKVNEKARALGLENSHFSVPDGYDTEGQYTTACDLAVIAKACLESPCISEIVANNRSYQKWVSGREVTYNNSNELLNPNSPYYRPEVIGIKTGNSSQAGACVVSAAVIDGKTYISVVMGSGKAARFQDSITIYDKIKAR